MKRKIIKGLVIFILINMLATSIGVFAAEELHWYCKRNKEHKQPSLDTNMGFLHKLGGIYVDRRYDENSEDKVIYLTFDAGYENGNIAKIMDTLKEENVKGSFFILGNIINNNPELIKRMGDEGHLVCNHTTHHKNLVGASKEKVIEELTTLENKYRDATGRELAKFFRPPEGTFDQTLLTYAAELGYHTVFWSFAYADWDNNTQMSKEKAMQKIMDNLHNGEIMLLHPTSNTNAEIMGDLIKELKVRGYRFATLDEITRPQPR